MVKSKGILFVTAILALSCTAFPTSEELLNPAEPESPNPTDLTDPAIQNNRRELAANGKIDLTVANKEGTPDDLAPPTREGNPEIALTEEELSELARCGFRGFGGGFNRPIILPIQGGLQPSVIDVNFASRGNGLNTNRPAIDWLTLLRLLG